MWDDSRETQWHVVIIDESDTPHIYTGTEDDCRWVMVQCRHIAFCESASLMRDGHKVDHHSGTNDNYLAPRAFNAPKFDYLREAA